MKNETLEVTEHAKNRLEYLRGELRKECISTGELCELQSLVQHIEPGDVELLEAAGVEENQETYECDNCDFKALAYQFDEAVDISQRIDPGGIYTDKECPKCGALAYPVEDSDRRKGEA